MPSPPQSFWISYAKRVARQVNIAWVLTDSIRLFIPYLLGVSALFLLLKQTGLWTELLWWPFGIGVFLLVLWSFFTNAKRFLSWDEALVLLDEEWALHSQLVSAQEGHSPWPIPSPRRIPIFQWKKSGTFLPFLCAVFVIGIVGGSAEKIDFVESETSPNYQVPPDLHEAEALLMLMKESDLVNPKSVEAASESLEELKSRDPSKWYDQSSLEAADAIREQIEGLAEGLVQEGKAALEKHDGNGETGTSPQSEKTQDPVKTGVLKEEIRQAIEDREVSDPSRIEAAREVKEGVEEIEQQLDERGSKRSSHEPGKSEKQGEKKSNDSKGETSPGEAESSQKANQRTHSSANANSSQNPTGVPDSSGGSVPLILKEKHQLSTSNNIEVLDQSAVKGKEGELKHLRTLDPGQREVSAVSPREQRLTGEGDGAVYEGIYSPGEQEILRRYFHSDARSLK